eukprot:13518193-Alexandrium_andersonii.AAC.1
MWPETVCRCKSKIDGRLAPAQLDPLVGTWSTSKQPEGCFLQLLTACNCMALCLALEELRG